MILNCVGPNGKVCTTRIAASAVIPLINSLLKLNFSSFSLKYEYRKFNTSKYISTVEGLNHYAQLINNWQPLLRGDSKHISEEFRRSVIKGMIDESLSLHKAC